MPDGLAKLSRVVGYRVERVARPCRHWYFREGRRRQGDLAVVERSRVIVSSGVGTAEGLKGECLLHEGEDRVKGRHVTVGAPRPRVRRHDDHWNSDPHPCRRGDMVIEAAAVVV